jgi:hypothetical protein
VIQNASHVFEPAVVIASRPGVIVFMSREVSPLYPKDKLIYSSELSISAVQPLPQFVALRQAVVKTDGCKPRSSRVSQAHNLWILCSEWSGEQRAKTF